MNRLLSVIVCGGIALGAAAQSSPYKGVSPDDLIDGDYYLYNVCLLYTSPSPRDM